MPLSASEQRRWCELETQLAKDRRLARASRRLTAGPRGGVPRWTSAVWVAGGGIGLLAAVFGAVLHSRVLDTAGLAVLAATVLLTGGVLIVAGIRGCWRQRRTKPRADTPDTASRGG
jgi:hypothetical protein